MEYEEALPVRAIKSGLRVPEDAPLDEQIRLLVKRVEQMEFEASEDRKKHKADVRSVRSEVSGLVARLQQTDRDLEALAESVAVSTVRLQIWGLILVGVGTTIMALPPIWAMSGLKRQPRHDEAGTYLLLRSSLETGPRHPSPNANHAANRTE